MSIVKDFWKNDWGFIWLLGFTVIAVAAAQFTTGTAVWAELLAVRFSLFVFTVVVIASSAISSRHKIIGYTVAVALLILAFFLAAYPGQIMIFIYAGLTALYMIIIRQTNFSGWENHRSKNWGRCCSIHTHWSFMDHALFYNLCHRSIRFFIWWREH